MFLKSFKSNPFLFKLWYFFYRKHRGVPINWFNNEIVFLLDGYPRSSNTFFAELSKRVFGENVFIHHFHKTAAIKIALSKKIPCFILIRNPADAISSNYLKSYALKGKKVDLNQINKRLLTDATNDYLTYYQYVLKNLKFLNLIVFEDCINKPKDVTDQINRIVYKSKFSIDDNTIEIFTSAFRGATDVLGSSKPNEVKQRLKSKLKLELNYLKNFNECILIYNKLKYQELKS
jgi:hypothetical protein